MAACPKCGSENPDDSKACSKCGAGITLEQARMPPPDKTAALQQAPNSDEKDLAKDIDDLGKRIGDAIGKDALGWWDRKFGFFGPVLAGILAAFGFLVFVLVIGAVEASADEPDFWGDLGDFLVEYAWLFVAWGFVSAFQNYLNRNHRRNFRWISPVISAVGFTIFFWVLSNVMMFAGTDFEKEDLLSQSEWLEGILPLIFVLVVLVGYGLAFLQWNVERTKKGQ